MKLGTSGIVWNALLLSLSTLAVSLVAVAALQGVESGDTAEERWPCSYRPLLHYHARSPWQEQAPCQNELRQAAETAAAAVPLASVAATVP